MLALFKKLFARPAKLDRQFVVRLTGLPDELIWIVLQYVMGAAPYWDDAINALEIAARCNIDLFHRVWRRACATTNSPVLHCGPVNQFTLALVYRNNCDMIHKMLDNPLPVLRCRNPGTVVTFHALPGRCEWVDAAIYHGRPQVLDIVLSKVSPGSPRIAVSISDVDYSDNLDKVKLELVDVLVKHQGKIKLSGHVEFLSFDVFDKVVRGIKAVRRSDCFDKAVINIVRTQKTKHLKSLMESQRLGVVKTIKRRKWGAKDIKWLMANGVCVKCGCALL